MASEPESSNQGLGILYFDPNVTTAKLATASLRLAGYEVFNAASKEEAIELCKRHGPSGDGRIAGLLLDASADPRKSASVLAGLVALPGSDQMPGILMVSRRQPNPIPGTEGLPKIRRPFSSPALLKVVERTLAEHRTQNDEPAHRTETEREARLAQILEKHLADTEISEEAVSRILAELEAAEAVPAPSGDESLEVDLRKVPLSAVLEMLGNAGVTGIVTVEGDGRMGELHVDQGRLRLAYYRGTDEDLKLGRFVVEDGHMRDEELEAYIIGRDPEGRPLGRRLVDGGFLTRESLAQIVLRQAREVACHLLAFSEGKVAFRVTNEPHPLVRYVTDASKAELQIAETLLDGLRRVEQAATMGPHMPHLDEVFLRLDDQLKKLGREIFDTEELGVLELVNGRNSVKEIARRTRTGTFAVAKIMFRLGKAKVVRRAMTPVIV